MSRLRLTKLDYRHDDSSAVGAPSRSEPKLLATAPGGDRIVADGGMVRCVTSEGKSRWTYTCAGVATEAYVSGDRLLLTTSSLNYHEWGNLGPAQLLDIGEGTPIAELRGERGAPLAEACFIVGLEGYDVFDSWLHDRNGVMLDTWRSYGHYVVDPDNTIRVVECDRNNPTDSRVVRLLPHGVIERGPSLIHGQVPRPVVMPDGTIVLLDCGVLRAVDRSLDDAVLAELLPIAPNQAWRFMGKLTIDDGLHVTISEQQEDSLIYITHHWAFAVTWDAQ